MSSPQNNFVNFLALEAVLNSQDLYEVRVENNISGQPIYIGKNQTPSADTSENSWYVKKMTYDSNGFLDYVQLPVNGPGFTYSWDARSTYF